MAGEARDNLWLTIGYVPAIVFVAHMGWIALQRTSPPPDAQPVPQTKIQVWLQDLILFPPAYALAMALGFDPRNLETLLFPSISLLIGFVAALDICAAYEIKSPLKRAGIVFASMALCVRFPWIGALGWFFERTIRAIRSRKLVPNRPTLTFILVSVAIYMLAFALPMGHGQTMNLGTGSAAGTINSVGFTSFGSINGELWGFGAYYSSFESFFYKVGLDEAVFNPPDYTIHFGDGRVPWLANPIFWIAIHFFLERRYAMAAFVGVGACALATGAHGPTPFTLWNSPGYIVWFLSMALPTIAALVLAIRERK